MIIDIRHGDCREVLKSFPDSLFDSLVTDPPYELSADGKASPNRVFVELVFPQHPKIQAEVDGEDALSFFVGEIARLCLGGSLPTPSATMPKGTVTLDGDASIRDGDVEDGNEASIGLTNANGCLDVESEAPHHIGSFALELGDGGDVSVLNTLAHVGCAFTAEGIEVGGLHGPPELREVLAILSECFTNLGGEVVGQTTDPLAALEGALAGAEDFPVFRVGAGRGAEDQFTTGGAFMFAAMAKATCAKLVRTTPATGGLPSVLESRRVRVVEGSTGRALSFDLVVRPQKLASTGFMGQRWDGSKVAFDVGLWREVLRVLKPGAHAVVFGADRTIHRLASAVEDAGFELRTMGFWVSASSFPKSLNISKAIDKRLGQEREVVGVRPDFVRRANIEKGRTEHDNYGFSNPDQVGVVTAAATEEAARWDGWGTALKNQEPWLLARKPFEGRTLVDNILKYGTGGLYIKGCRLPGVDRPLVVRDHETGADANNVYGSGLSGSRTIGLTSEGRWPSAVICSDEDVDGLDGVSVIMDVDAEIGLSGVLGPYTKHFRIGDQENQAIITALPEELLMRILPTGVVAPKASTGEREMGLDEFDHQWVDPTRVEGSAGRANPRAGAGRSTKRKNTHPTVKPIGLMRHLVRLVTPPGGKVLDPFCGVASTGVAAIWEGKSFLGIELTDTDEQPYVRIAKARCDYAKRLHRVPEITHRTANPQEVDEKQTTLGF